MKTQTKINWIQIITFVIIVSLILLLTSCASRKPGLYSMNNPCLGKKYFKSQKY